MGATARALFFLCPFALWDVLLGTFEHVDRHDHFAYGIESGATAQDVRGQRLAPFAAWRALATWTAAPRADWT